MVLGGVMEIQSAYSSGLQGFQKAQNDANESALAINNANAANIDEQDAGSEKVNASNEVVNVNQEVVNLNVAEYQAKASIEVVKSADENLGTLLDVTV